MTAALLWTFALPLLVGVGLCRWMGLRRKAEPLAFLGWSWCVGTFATALLIFAWLWIEPARTSTVDPGGTGPFPHTLGAPWGVRLALLVLCAVAFWRAGTDDSQEEQRGGPERQVAPFERAFWWACVVFAFVSVGLRALLGSLRPIVQDDETHFWALKAKMLFVHGGFGEAFGALAQEPRLYNADYPLFNPLLQVWSFANAGELTYVANRVPIQLFGLALVAILAPALARVVRPAIAGLLLVCFTSLVEVTAQLQRGHADLMLGLGGLVALDAWLRWHATGRTVWRRLAFFGIAFLLWSKNEGQLVLAALLGAALVQTSWRALRRNGWPRPRRSWWWAALPGGVLLLHRTTNAHFGWKSGFLQNDMREGGILALLLQQLPERLGPIVRYYATELVLAPAFSAGLLVLLIALWCVAPRRLASTPLAFASCTIAIVYAGYVAVFLGAPHDLTWHLTTAAQRVGFQPLAATTLVVGAGMAAVFPQLRGGSR